MQLDQDGRTGSHALPLEVNRIVLMLGEFSIGTASADAASHNTRRAGPPPAKPSARPIASPARQLTTKLATDFQGKSTHVNGNWGSSDE